MFTRFKNGYETIFLDTKSEKRSLSAKVNIILSPSFYWVKKVTLPLKSAREVKKIAPSLFEEILTEGNYSYSAYKRDGFFLAFAYDDQFILDALAALGIESSHIASLCFAQSEFEEMQMPLKISENEALYLKEDLVVLVPLTWLETYASLDTKTLQFSGHKIFLRHYASVVDHTIFYKVASLLLLLCAILGAEYFIMTKKTKEFVLAKEEIFAKYELKPTTMQNESLLKKYHTSYKHQNAMREYLYEILSLKLNGDIWLVDCKDEKFLVDFQKSTKADQEKLQTWLQTKKADFKISESDQNLHLEIVL